MHSAFRRQPSGSSAGFGETLIFFFSYETRLPRVWTSETFNSALVAQAVAKNFSRAGMPVRSTIAW